MKKNLLFSSALILSVAANAQWTSQATGYTAVSRGVRDVCAVDANTVWIAAYDGSGGGAKVHDFSKTTDGGTTWTPGVVTTPTNYEWSNISAISGTTAWGCFYDATAGGGGIFKTTDGGATWTAQTVGFTTASFPDIVHFWDANNGIAIGDPAGGYFEIYTTTNGGTTWTRTATGSIPAPLSGEYGIVNLYSVLGNTVWFGTNTGRMYKSVDKGLNWTVSVVSTVTTDVVTDVSFRTAQEGIATVVDAGGTVFSPYKSTDGGATWSFLTVTSGTFFTSDLEAIPNSSAYVSTGANTTVSTGSSYSVDGGATWVTIDTAIQHTAQGWVNGSTGWCGGFNTSATADGIYKYSGATLGVPALTRDNARMRLYPNPSSGQFTVQIGGAEPKDAYVTVVDIVGSVVYESTISNRSTVIQKPFDLTGISPGVYFVNVVNGTTRFSNKITIK
jgi:hypothetical protein